MVDGFTDPFIPLNPCHSWLLADSTQRWPFALYPSVLMCQCAHTCFGHAEQFCVCAPPEDDLQSIDLEAHSLEHNKTVVYVQAAGVHCQGEQHLVLGRCRAPYELARQIISF